MNDHHHQHHQQQQRMLPPGWVEATDPNSGRIYYANVDTHETRWSPPPAPGYDAKATTSSFGGSGSGGGSGGGGGGGGGGRGVRSSSREFRTTSSTSPSMETTTTATRRRTGNPLYSADDNIAYDNPAKLVVMTRNMLDKAAAFPEQTTKSDLELYSITPGQIADLCRLQQQSSDTTSCSVIDGGGTGGIPLGVGQQIIQQQQQQQPNEGKKLLAYTPINPYRIATSTKAQITEKARLDVRIHSLKQKLVQFGGRNPEL